MLKILAALSLICACSTVAWAQEDEVPMPHFMVGAWGQGDETRWSDEFWTPPRGGLMIGAARSGSGDGLQFWEHARIMRGPDGRLRYVAMPMGEGTTEFALVAASETMIEFANPAHDYPQRIRYWRDGDQLMAEVSLMDGSRAERWTMAPMGD